MNPAQSITDPEEKLVDYLHRMWERFPNGKRLHERTGITLGKCHGMTNEQIARGYLTPYQAESKRPSDVRPGLRRTRNQLERYSRFGIRSVVDEPDRVKGFEKRMAMSFLSSEVGFDALYMSDVHHALVFRRVSSSRVESKLTKEEVRSIHHLVGLVMIVTFGLTRCRVPKARGLVPVLETIRNNGGPGEFLVAAHFGRGGRFPKTMREWEGWTLAPASTEQRWFEVAERGFRALASDQRREVVDGLTKKLTSVFPSGYTHFPPVIWAPRYSFPKLVRRSRVIPDWAMSGE